MQETIGGYSVGHYYYDDEGTSNAYVWHDENGTLFYLGERISDTAINELALSFIQKYN